jgi:predicted Zn-dependent protease
MTDEACKALADWLEARTTNGDGSFSQSAWRETAMNLLLAHGHHFVRLAAEVERQQEYIREADRRVGEQFTAAQNAEARALALSYQRLFEFKRAEEAERDAARYRWLRECDYDGDAAIHTADGRELKMGADLDAAIDAALAVQNEQSVNGESVT